MARSTICIACGQPTLNGSRCVACNRGFQRAVHNPQYDTREWRALRRRAIADWVAVHGWWCPGFRRPGHASRDLTLDHVLPGSLEQGTQVLCRGCNTRKRWSDTPTRRGRR